MASSAENIRDRMKLVEEKRFLQEEVEHRLDDEALEAVPRETWEPGTLHGKKFGNASPDPHVPVQKWPRSPAISVVLQLAVPS